MKKNNSSGDLFLKELERMSHDEIRVCNPTKQDFKQAVDGRIWVFPCVTRDLGDGKGFRVVPRYVAKLYRKHFIDHMINEANDSKIIGELKKWTGTKKDFYENQEEKVALKTNNEVLRRKFGNGKMPDGTKYSGLWISIVRKHGLDLDAKEEPEQKADTRPLDDKLFEDQDLPTDDFLKEISA